MRFKKHIVGTLLGASLLGGGSLVADNAINPYATVGNKLEIVAISTLPEAGKVEVDAMTDKPKVMLKKWNGEVNLGVTYTGLPDNTAGGRVFLSKNVEWSDANQTMEAVPVDATPTEDGGMEINIILNSKPASNVFSFQLENWENLDFFYQPPLTDEEIKEGATRPDNVVGSYAVYYRDHANHKVGDINYATGKAYHIYRPQVTDAKGNATWAELSYDNAGTLVVTVPQSFLDSAVYPVTVDPTFGYTTQGASDTVLTSSSFDAKAAQKGTSILGSLVSVSAYLKVSTAGSGVSSNGEIYSDTGTVPNALLAFTADLGVSSTGYTLITSSLSFSFTGSSYWVAIEGADDGIHHLRIASDAGGGTGAYSESDVSGGAWIADSNRYSVYATYTATVPDAYPTVDVDNGAQINVDNGAQVTLPYK